MPAIRSLRPAVTRDQALRQFSATGLTSACRFLFCGPLRAIADFYLPFQIYEVSVRNRGTSESRIFAIDTVEGSLDLYQLDSLPHQTQVVAVETRNCRPRLLNDTGVGTLLVNKLRRLLFQQGFFRIHGLEIDATPQMELHIPYWVAFRGNQGRVRISVIDAVRRQFEGAKVRNLIETWLLNDAGAHQRSRSAVTS